MVLRKNVPASPDQTRPPVKHVPYHGEVAIFYGTQTGTAAKLANNLGLEARANGFKPRVVDLSSLKPDQDLSQQKLSLFLVATSGEGDPTDNAKWFMKYLKGKTVVGMPDLNGHSYSVFGLGSSSYEHYNKMGKDLNQLLQKRGGRRVHTYGQGDDNYSIEEGFNQWKSTLWEELRKIRPVLTDAQGIMELDLISVTKDSKYHRPEDLKLIQFAVVQQSKTQACQFLKYSYDQKEYEKSHPAEVIKKREVRQSTVTASTLHIAFSSEVEYQPAQNLMVFPQNDEALVRRVLEYWRLDGGEGVDLLPKNEDVCLPFKTPMRLDALLRTRVDLTKKLQKLELFPLIPRTAKKPDFKTLFTYIQHNKLQVSFGLFLNYCEAIKPRAYTICSAGPKNPQLVIKLEQFGLTSNCLQRTQIGAKLRLLIKPSSFVGMFKWKHVLMVGAGTGVAPFLAFLQYKEKAMARGETMPGMTLFFGCRHPEQDFIFREELTGWRQKGVLNNLFLAFSREQEKKVYVQHLLRDQKELAKEWLLRREDGAVFICGSTGMGSDVCGVLKLILAEEGVNSQTLFRQLEDEQRVVKELW